VQGCFGEWYYDEGFFPCPRDEMTLTYAIIANGGIVLTADSQLTFTHRLPQYPGAPIIATYENTRHKIRRLRNGSAFSVAGNNGLIDTLLAKADAEPIDDSKSFNEVVLAYSQFFRDEYASTHGNIDLHMRQHAEFLFCGYSGKAIPQIVKLASSRDFFYDAVAAGEGYGLTGDKEHGGVLYLHHRFYRGAMPLDTAKLLAYCILAEVADSSTSIGPPIEMVVITKSGAAPILDFSGYEEKRQELIGKVKMFLGA
jgi:hypothetical protein